MMNMEGHSTMMVRETLLLAGERGGWWAGEELDLTLEAGKSGVFQAMILPVLPCVFPRMDGTPQMPYLLGVSSLHQSLPIATPY